MSQISIHPMSGIRGYTSIAPKTGTINAGNWQ
jgi:hypothetical protein